MKKPMLLLLAATTVFLAACSTTRSIQRALIGSWETAPYPPGSTNRAKYHFSSDGSYSHTDLAIPVASQVRETKGSYSVEPGNLLVMTGGVTGLMAQQFFFKDGNLHLVVSTREGQVIETYRRAGSQ